ncbi:TPA: hypothetical protein ACH3X1_013472 [Trebouxia sp. C0004]
MQLTGNAWNDWPCNLESTGEMGRFLVASTSIDREQVVLLSEAYLTALIPSYKKRICHYCLEDHQKRLTVCCKRCNQAWYCSPQCQHAHWAGRAHATSEGPSLQSPASSIFPSSSSPCHLSPPPTSYSVCAPTRHVVPHSLTCAVLKRFSSIKCDPGMESVVRMCLDAMALQLLNTQADAAALADHQSFTKASLYDAERNGHHSQENCTDQGATQTPQRPGLSTTRVPLHLQQMVFELGDDHQLQQRQDEQLNADSQKPLQQLGGGKVAQQQQQVQQSGEDPHQIQHHHCDSQPEEQQHNLPRQPWHAPELPLLAHQDLLQLQSHAADFADKDRRDWRINIRFLRLSMQQATWPGPVWPEAELLDMVGRIVSNNFGIYTSRQRQQPHHAHLNAQDDGALAGEASSRSALQGVSSLSSGSTGEEATEKTRGHLLPLPTPKPSSSSQYVTPWPMQADTEQLVRSNSVSPLHGNSTADVCDTQRLFPALDSAVGALSVDGPAQCCTQHSKSSAPRHTEAELSQVQRGRAATGIQKAKEDVIGREMYITASFFNHSCEPNCVKTRVHGQHSGLATVTALRDIKAGEALTISYIDLELPRSARQLELKTSFFFDCKCIR